MVAKQRSRDFDLSPGSVLSELPPLPRYSSSTNQTDASIDLDLECNEPYEKHEEEQPSISATHSPDPAIPKVGCVASSRLL